MTPLEQARQAGKDEPRGIVGAAGLDPTSLVQRQLFSQEEILRRELGMRPHHRRRQRCHIVSDGENRSNQIPRRFGHDPTDRMRTLNRASPIAGRQISSQTLKIGQNRIIADHTWLALLGLGTWCACARLHLELTTSNTLSIGPTS
jgi:hypothetical protein